MKILIVSAECRGLAKVGGLGDVTADLCAGLTALHHEVTLFLPAYGQIAPGTAKQFRAGPNLQVTFAGQNRMVPTWIDQSQGYRVVLPRSPEFSGEFSSVYIDSAALGRGPFEDDAHRFAFFSAAALSFLHQEEIPFSVIHLQDWHTGLLALHLAMRPYTGPEVHPRPGVVFTIHNLDYQGVRPLSGGISTLERWWPGFWDSLDQEVQLRCRDPKYPQGINFLRSGISFADRVTTVSPTYAQEILLPDDPSRGFVGGRGLEDDLRERREQGHFFGWLNGLDYSLHNPETLDPPYGPLGEGTRGTTVGNHPGTGGEVRQAKLVHKHRLLNDPRVLRYGAPFAQPDLPLGVMVTRITSQKVALLLEELDGKLVLDHLLDRRLNLIILGTGDRQRELEDHPAHARMRYLPLFDPGLSTLMYAGSDLFFMPSDFEPCGLSQLQALRYGSLPLVHHRGGLADTVEDEKTGWMFSGSTRTATRRAFLETLDRALNVWETAPEVWDRMVERALAQKFDWAATLSAYENLYRGLVLKT